MTDLGARGEHTLLDRTGGRLRWRGHGTNISGTIGGEACWVLVSLPIMFEALSFSPCLMPARAWTFHSAELGGHSGSRWAHQLTPGVWISSGLI